MAIVKIAPVTRQGMKLLISLFGMSETGKTLSALLLAAGLEPDPMKRGLLDTEGGQRGRAYADSVPGGFMYGSLGAPFTPERYMEALSDFVEAGVTTLVMDSGSHAWFAAGGVLDMVENATEKNDMAKWAKPKRRIGKMTQQWNQCGLHLIICSRGKQPMLEEYDANGKKKYVLGPVVPIQEKTMRFDMTIMAHMLGDGHFSVAKSEGGKCPGSLRPVFESGDKMNIEMGKKLIAWIGGQDMITPAHRALSMKADDVAQEGVASYHEFWTGLTKPEREYLLPQHENFKSIAKAADAEKLRRTEDEGEDNLSDPFAGKAMPSGVHHTSESPEPTTTT
jgi:hypothetical protein